MIMMTYTFVDSVDGLYTVMSLNPKPLRNGMGSNSITVYKPEHINSIYDRLKFQLQILYEDMISKAAQEVADNLIKLSLDIEIKTQSKSIYISFKTK